MFPLTKTLSPTTFSSWSCRVIALSAMLSLVCRSPAARKSVLRCRKFQDKRWDLGAMVTIQVNL